jgi:hypothetical protein
MGDDRIYCDGKQHRVEVDVVTFIEQPDQVFRTLVIGDEEHVRESVAKIKEDKAPSATIFYEYCCDACKEVVSGS